MDNLNNSVNNSPAAPENEYQNQQPLAAPIRWKAKISLFKNSNFIQFLIISIFLAPIPIYSCGDGPDCNIMFEPLIFGIILSIVIPFFIPYFIMGIQESVSSLGMVILMVIFVFLFAFIFFHVKNYFLKKFSVRWVGIVTLIATYLLYCVLINIAMMNIIK